MELQCQGLGFRETYREGKRPEERTHDGPKVMLAICATVAHMLLSMMMDVIIQFRKRKRDRMAAEDTEDEDEGGVDAVPDAPEDDEASSSSASVTGPNKRARLDENEDTDGLAEAFESACNRLAEAIKKCAALNMDFPHDLFEKVQELPGFDDTHKSGYYAYLAVNPHVGRAFYNAPVSYRLCFIKKWVNERCPG